MTYSPEQLRRVDVLVAEMTGWTDVRHMYAREVEMTGTVLLVDDLVGCPGYGRGPSWPVPFFTLEPSAAYLALDWLRAECYSELLSVVTTDATGTTCHLVVPRVGLGPVGWSQASTPAQAICFAVLKQRGLSDQLEQALHDDG